MVPGRTVRTVPSSSIGCSLLIKNQWKRRPLPPAKRNFKLLSRKILGRPAARTVATATAFFTRTGFIHRKDAAVQLFVDQTFKSGFRAFFRRHGDEGKPARTARGT